jgi:sortase A
MKITVRWLRLALFAGGIAMLAYCGFAVVDSWTFQKQQRRQFESLMADRALATPAPIAANGVIGLLDIPRLGLSVMVIEGVGTKNLRRAAGHIPGTALPGQPGNAGISAHRDTFFRPLRNIRQNDVITINTGLGEYRYRVVSTRIVSPSDVAVLDSGGEEVLTLVTCYPFYFVGSAPDRFIVRAVRINSPITALFGSAGAGRLR